MALNLFKTIRKSYFADLLFSAFLSNLIIFAQPIQMLISQKQVVTEHQYASSPATETHMKEIVAKSEEETVISSSKPITKLLFPSVEASGKIGKESDIDSENPSDNFFKVLLPNEDLSKYDALLSYELYGLENATETTKSINFGSSYGGKVVHRTTKWTSAREYIPISQLKPGANEIFFNRRTEENYSYEIKNLKIELVEKKGNLVNANAIVSEDGSLYIVGTASEDITSISISGKPIKIYRGTFEHEASEILKGNDLIQLSYATKLGNKSIQVPIQRNRNTMISFDNSPLVNTLKTATLDEMKSGLISYDEASIVVANTEALSNYSKILVRGIDFKDLRLLNSEAENVTAGKFPGYRISKTFIPDSIPTKLHLKYDDAKIPDGYTPQDIKTFYFDNNARSWKELAVDSIDTYKKEIISTLTNEGTDYINGIIKVPESPETGSFAPTAMNDIKYADPASGVVSISPPSPNNTGTVNTSFPIKLPQGRNGMSPSLAVTYNSDAGNGWMGIGWNLSTPAITLNTTWGAPLYNQNSETEIYSMNGSDLVLLHNGSYTNPHRDANIQRAQERIFYERKEGAYNMIVRHGNSPTNYWWEVTDKQGNKTFYGGLPGSGVVNNAVIKTADGQIGHWGITRSQDPFGNYVEYTYNLIQNTFVPNSAVPAKKFYIDNIRYAKNTATPNYYQIDFKKNSYTVQDGSEGLLHNPRTDISTNARNGYIQLTDDLLTEIHVSLVTQNAPTLIRKYRFNYKEHAFSKRQLEKIAEFDKNGALFYSNTMEYYNDIGSQAIISGEQKFWGNAGDDDVNAPLKDLAGPSSNLITSSPLGSSVGSGFSAGLRVGVGLGANAFSVANTGGGSISYNSNNSETRISFMDLNGDGLPDKIYKSGNTISYRPGFRNGNLVGFGSNLIPISGQNTLSKTKSKTTGYGFDFNLLGYVGAGKSFSTTRAETDGFFTDQNGDGLPDMISGGGIWFNTASDPAYQNINFVNDVTLSENKIESGNIHFSMIENLQLQSMDELREENPQFDHVKVWTAPYGGTVNIEGTAKLINKNIYNGKENKFRVTIEKSASGGATNQIGPPSELQNVNQSIAMNRSSLTVAKGDVFFFRTHNLNDGYGGEVDWNPKITYTVASSLLTPFINQKDEHGKLLNVFNSQEDFAINNGGSVAPKNNDTSVNIDFNVSSATGFGINSFSDNITFSIKKITTNLQNGNASVQESLKLYNHLTGSLTTILTTNQPLPTGSIPVSQSSNYNISFQFSAESTSNINWGLINWQPKMTGNYSGLSYPVVNYVTYDDNVNQTSYVIKGSELPTPIINPAVSGDANKNMMVFRHNMFEANQKNWLQSLPNEEYPAKVNWVIKEDRGNGVVTAVASKTFYIRKDAQNNIIFTKSETPTDILNPALSSNFHYFEFFIKKSQIKTTKDNGGNYYGAFYINNVRIGNNNPTSITLSIAPTETSNYPVFLKTLTSPFWASNPSFYGNSFKKWGQFLYNGGLKFTRNSEGNINFGIAPLNYGNANIDAGIFNFESQAQTVTAPGYNPESETQDYANLRFTFYEQENQTRTYRNDAVKVATFGFTGANLTAKIGRFAEANTHLLYVDPQSLLQGSFVGLKIRTLAKGSAVSGNALYASGTLSEGNSEVLSQYIDINGDRYPDFVTGGKIQYTNARGAISNKFSEPHFVSGDQSKDRTAGLSIPISPNSTSTTGSTTSKNKTNTNVSAGINASTGESFNSRQWIDMNGDGLPDQVTITENSVSVRINTGYEFMEAIDWGNNLTDLLTSQRNNASVGLSFNFGSSFAAGFGMAKSTANITSILMDVNGDQLPDLVVKQGQTYRYYLNNGRKFDTTTPPATFYNGNKIEEDISYSGNAFGTATAGFSFPLLFLIIKVVFTPSAGISTDYSEKRATVQDIDGDGMPDLITNSGNNVNAILNQVKKTHLLKKVNTPLGGSWEVEYNRDGNTYDMPHSKWTMARLITNDGFAGDNGLKPDNSYTSIVYKNPKYDRRERAFFGYEKVIIKEMQSATITAVPYRTLVKSFHTENYYLNGAQKASALYKGDFSLDESMNEMLTEERTTYNILNGGGQTSLGQNASNNFGQSTDILDKSRLFVTVARVESSAHEAGQSLTATKDFKEYDYYGNLKKIVDHGEGPNDAYRTEIDYYSSVSGLTYGPGFPSKIRVFKNSTGELMRQRKSEYANGKPTKIETMLSQQEASVININYDDFGNLSQIRSPFNTNESGDEYYINLEYDSVLHTYPTSVSNAFGEQSQTWYDYLFGIPKYTTDVNGQSMRTRIDDKGRTVEITGPNELALENGNGNPDADGNAWTIRMEYKSSFSGILAGNPNPSNSQHYAITRHFDPEYATGINTTNQLLTVSIVDGFGQPLQVKKKHISENGNRWLLSPLEMKDAFGRTLESYQAGFQTNTSFSLSSADLLFVNNGTLTTAPVVMTYDERDRIMTVQQPLIVGMPLDLAYMNYAIEDGMFVQQSTNELNQTENSFTDIRGRNRKTVQNGLITTTFVYNAINELKEVINNEGFATKYIYDLAGRKTEVQHPDRGVVTFKYDKASRMTEQSTSNLLLLGGQKIKYKYDFGRLVAIEYPDVPQNNVSYKYGKLSNNLAVAEKAVGRLLEQKDATGIQVFGYGRMGEVTKNVRSVAVAGYQSFWFYTKWKYDSWNRVKEITYPDQEVLKYHYNLAGSLNRISSQMNGINPVQDVITAIKYNDYGERAEISHGNLTKTLYTYDVRRRLNTLKHEFNSFNIQKRYEYDQLSNITGISTDTPSSSLPGTGQIGGPVSHTYGYDAFNRITTATGTYTGANDNTNPYLAQRYSLAMEYNTTNHNIKTKIQSQWQGTVASYGANPANEIPVYKNSYKLDYSGYGAGTNTVGTNYSYTQPHAVTSIVESPTWIDAYGDDPRIRVKEISYDANGNQTEIKEKVGEVKTSLRQNLWDAVNRIRAVNLKPDDANSHPIAIYTYNAGGERTVRYNYDHIGTFSNEQKVGQVSKDNVMLYPSGLLMGKAYHDRKKEPIDRIRYTKHYYVGSERISAKTGSILDLGMFPIDLLGSEMPQLNVQEIRNKSKEIAFESAPKEIIKVHSLFNVPSPALYPIDELTKISFRHDEKMLDYFYFHPDHLGSSSYITNLDGVVSQHMEYLPFGETLADEHLNSRNSPFKYNGKEFDEETGNYYYGARYYDPKWSIWLSVDPLAEKYPRWSPYSYCFNNPVRFTDPDGMAPDDVTITIGKEATGTTQITILGDKGSKPTQMTVNTYTMTVTDDVTGVATTYQVTRDGPTRNSPNSSNVNNSAFEPKQDTVSYQGVMDSDYPRGTGLPAIALRNENGGTALDAERMPGATRENPDKATGVSIHVGGNYKNAERESVSAGSLGCFTVVGGEAAINQLGNDVNTRIDINGAAEAGTNININVEKRNDVQKTFQVD